MTCKNSKLRGNQGQHRHNLKKRDADYLTRPIAKSQQVGLASSGQSRLTPSVQVQGGL